MTVHNWRCIECGAFIDPADAATWDAHPCRNPKGLRASLELSFREDA